MTILTQLKVWAAAVGGGVILIGLLLLRVFNSGRQAQRADEILEQQKQEDRVDDAINNATQAGTDTRHDIERSPDRLHDDDGFKRGGRTH